MIPSNTGFLNEDFVIKEQPGKTYKLETDENAVRGVCDGIEAVKQAIFRILNTERYKYIIYSWNYGIETLDLYGEPVSYVCPELERRITEALCMDSRITGVSDFKHDISVKKTVHTEFTVHTVFGEVQSEKEVNI